MRSSIKVSHLLAGPLAIAAVAAIGVGASAMSASASVTDVLYSTQGDFSGWTGDATGPTATPPNFTYTTVATVATPTEGGTTNGITSATPGATGTAGALQITMPNGIGIAATLPSSDNYFVAASSPGGLNSNTALVNALNEAFSNGGYVTVNFTYPTGNSYFNAPRFLLNYNGEYGQQTGVASKTADANGFYQDTVSVTGLPLLVKPTYLNFGLIFNAVAPAGSVVNISNITLTYNTPEPASVGLLGAGAAGLLLLGRKRIFA